MPSVMRATPDRARRVSEVTSRPRVRIHPLHGPADHFVHAWGLVSRRSSCGCLPCAGLPCPRPSGTRRRRSRRRTGCDLRSRRDRARRSRGRPRLVGAPAALVVVGTANPFSVEAPRSTSTGLVNFRTMARSSRSMMHTLNTPPASISSCVYASVSTEIPSSFGSNASCVAQLSVMRLRRSTPSVEPTTYRPLGIVQSTRRRSRSYSSGSAPSGNGGTGPSLTGMSRAYSANSWPTWRGAGARRCWVCPTGSS